MKFKALVVCAVLALTVSACRKKPAALPVPEVPVTSAPSGNEAQVAESNASVMTLMLQEFAAKNGRMPKDVSELSTITSYGAVPKPPAGYKFIIDAAQKQVRAVKQ